jgi:hypothetical protein
MKTWIKGVVAALLMGIVILGSLPALAEPWGPRPFRPQMNQSHRFNPGMYPGSRAPGQFHYRGPQQGHFRMAEARMRADGHLNRNERARLQRMQNHAGRDMYRHNYNNRYNHHNRRPGWH